ncbi:MAG: DNA-3-methyladenine glycosylase 2 family protein [Candidatus Acidiferrum sp.]
MKKRFPESPECFVSSAAPARVVLDQALLLRAVTLLTSRDRDLARVVARYGPPPLWVREPGFPSLLYIILEQQVSLASARALYQRVLAEVRPLTPGRFLKLSDVRLRELGFSRQKALYARLLAEAIRGRQLALHSLHELEDHSAREQLTALKGIGVWTADIYLMSALRRPDIWPVGDLALATAVQEVKRLRHRPSRERLEALSKPWQPWRSVAARIFWHAYLSKRGQTATSISL